MRSIAEQREQLVNSLLGYNVTFRSGLAFGGVRVRCLCVRCVLCLVCLPLRVRPRVCPVLVLRFCAVQCNVMGSYFLDFTGLKTESATQTSRRWVVLFLLIRPHFPRS